MVVKKKKKMSVRMKLPESCLTESLQGQLRTQQLLKNEVAPLSWAAV